MSRNKKFYIHRKANRDLEGIFIYIVENFGRERAEKYLDELVSAFHELASGHSQGRDCSHIYPNLYGYNVASHVVYYESTKEGVSIYRILHKSMDHIKHIDN